MSTLAPATMALLEFAERGEGGWQADQASDDHIIARGWLGSLRHRAAAKAPLGTNATAQTCGAFDLSSGTARPSDLSMETTTGGREKPDLHARAMKSRLGSGRQAGRHSNRFGRLGVASRFLFFSS
jgi:hypothetical protein